MEPLPDLRRAMERVVIGADYGADGYTTRAQADVLGRALHLGAGVDLLDFGAGRGWPGVYLAATSGCDVVISDLLAADLRFGLDRAARDGFGSRCRAVVATARDLPFAPTSFDAVVSTDTLC